MSICEIVFVLDEYACTNQIIKCKNVEIQINYNYYDSIVIN